MFLPRPRTSAKTKSISARRGRSLRARLSVERLEARTLLANALNVSIGPMPPATVPEGQPLALAGMVSDPNAPGANDFSYAWRAAEANAGTSLEFDGVNDFVKVNRPVQDDFTLEAWIRTTKNSRIGTQFHQGDGLLYADTQGVGNDFGTAILNNKFAFGTGNPDRTVQSTSLVNTGQWVHVAAVRIMATGTIKVFVNGVEENSLNTGNTVPLSKPAQMTIGGNLIDLRMFKGQIDDVRVWNIARTQAEIQATMFQSLTGTEPGLVDLWHFNEGSGTTITDSTASPNNGVLGGGDPNKMPAYVASTAPLQGLTTLDTGAASNFTFTPPNQGSFVVTLHASRPTGVTGAASVVVATVNAAPTAFFKALAPVTEGDTAVVAFDTVFDSQADMAAGLLYSYDFNNDGDFDDAGDVLNSPSPSSNVPASMTAEGPASFVVHGRVADHDGAFNDYTATVTVTNVHPSADPSGGATIDEGGSATVSLSNPTDPSAVDTQAGFHFAFALDGASLDGATYANSGTDPSATYTFNDGPGNHTVTVRIFDKDDGFRDYTVAIHVNNVAPTAMLAGGDTADEGSAVSVSLTNPLDPSAADTSAGFHYAFAVDGASLDGATYANSGTDATNTFTFTDGPSDHTVTVRIFDKDGGFTDYTADVPVNNIAPTATLSGGGSVDENTAVSVSLSAPFDPSSDDTQAGFHYAFAVDGASLDGATYANSGTDATAAFTFSDGPGDHSVTVRILDKDGGFTDYTATVQVNNVAPTATLSGGGTLDEGGSVSVSLSNPFDPSPEDTQAGFHYAFALDGASLDGVTYANSGADAAAAFNFSDGAGDHTVMVRILDKDGGFTDYTAAIHVNNVAPTATLSGGGTIDEGGLVTVSLSGPFDPSSEDTQAGFRYAFAVNGASLDGATYANGSTDPAATFTFSDGPADHTVTVRIFDKDGGFTDYTAAVHVKNIVPTATLVGGGTVDEGSPVSVSLTNPSDPSPDDTQAGFHYAFALDGASLAGASYANSGTDPSATFTFNDGPSDHTVTVRIFDKDGGFTDYTAAIHVEDPIPTAKIVGPADGVRGQPRTFHASAGNSPPGAPFSYKINWGDGTPVQTVSGPAGGVKVEHVFAKKGPYTVQMTATNEGGNASEPATASVMINVVALQADPLQPGLTALAVGGTLGGDDIEFSRKGKDGVEVCLNGQDMGTFHPTGRLLAFGHAGDDDIRVSNKLSLPAWLYGGDGDDDLRGGDGDDVLLGGAGKDELRGRGGRDLLIGGLGKDQLRGGEEGDILIGGTTDHDAHDAALAAIMAEWTSARDHATRIANLKGTGSGPSFDERLNGDIFLTINVPGATVLDDGAEDVLHGAKGQDWFLAFASDKVKDQKPGEEEDQ